MTDKNKHCWIRLTSAIAYVTLLSACGAGANLNPTEPEAPDIGQAIDSSTIPTTLEPQTEAIPVPNPEPQTEAIPAPIPEPQTEAIPAPIPEPQTEAIPVPIPEQPIESVAVVPPTNVSCNAAAEDIKNSTLSLINTARATARSCGDTFFEAAPPLAWNDKLATAAHLHSVDMAQNNFFSHTGSDGLSVSQRVDEQQYNWRRVGENIAAGQPTTESAIDAWLDSPGHCENLMSPNFTEMAVDCVEDNGSQYRQYWTNVLGSSF